MPSNFAEVLNTNCASLFRAVEDVYVPLEYRGLTESMTGYSSTGQDAFVLNPPIAGFWRDLRIEPGIAVHLQPQGDRFILRVLIGYAMAARCANLNDDPLGILGLANLINAMVGAAYKVYGSRIEHLSFENPAYTNEFFRELENNEGYEIRLWGKLTPVIEPLEMEVVE